MFEFEHRRAPLHVLNIFIQIQKFLELYNLLISEIFTTRNPRSDLVAGKISCENLKKVPLKDLSSSLKA